MDITKDPLYSTWNGIKQRCRNKNDKAYKNYGGRGITVCERWLKSFHDFKKDMGKRPKGFSIERLNNNGDYCANNCVWADRKTQSKNTRKRIYITYKNRRETLEEWSRIFGISINVLGFRHRKGWSPKDILETKAKVRRSNKIIKYKGKEMRISQWADELGISHSTLKARICRYKWSVKKSIETPIQNHYTKVRR